MDQRLVAAADEETGRIARGILRLRPPCDLGYCLAHPCLDWDEFSASPAYRELLAPAGLRYSLGSAERYHFCLMRSRRSPPFSRQEARFFAALAPQLSNYYALYLRAVEGRPAPATREELGPAAAALTRREAEVVGHLARGLTAGEVASVLLISRRTVESHVARAYEKLGVSSRAELLARLPAALRIPGP